LGQEPDASAENKWIGKHQRHFLWTRVIAAEFETSRGKRERDGEGRQHGRSAHAVPGRRGEGGEEEAVLSLP